MEESNATTVDWLNLRQRGLKQLTREIGILMTILDQTTWEGTAHDVTATLSQDKTWTAAAFDATSGEVVGMGTVSVLRTFHGVEARIDNMVVRPEYHGSGAANQIMAMLTERARAEGAAWAELTCGRQRRRARAFYTKHGFVETLGGVFQKSFVD